MKTKKQEIIDILKYDAYLQETTDHTNYEIENIDEIAEKIVKLFSMSDVSQQRELLKAFQTIESKEGRIDLRKMTDEELDQFIKAFNCG